MQGDCLELMKDIPDGSVDMILADLPYGTTACKWDTIIPFEQLWEQYERVIKDNGAIVLFCSGTTGVACKNLNCNFIGMELDETYFNIAKDRIENHEKENVN